MDMTMSVILDTLTSHEHTIEQAKPVPWIPDSSEARQWLNLWGRVSAIQTKIGIVSPAALVARLETLEYHMCKAGLLA